MRLFPILLFIRSSISFTANSNAVRSQEIGNINIPPPHTHIALELREIQDTIQNVVGSRVYWLDTHELCKEGLYGAYIPAKDAMFICIRNHDSNFEELLGTAKHEGWHAVQLKRNSFRAALLDNQIRPHLKPRDHRTLHSYHPTQHRAEAEARVTEQIPTENWIKGVKEYCK